MSHHTDHFGVKRLNTSLHPDGPDGLIEKYHSSMKAWVEKDWAKVEILRDRLMPIHAAIFCETSPAPVKYGLSLLGKCAPDVRLPLVSASETARAKVEAAMKKASLFAAFSVTGKGTQSSYPSIEQFNEFLALNE